MDIASLISILIGGGILGFIQYLLNRHDNKKEKNDELFKAINEIKKDLDSVKESQASMQAAACRVRILSFSDGIRHGEIHSEEMFNQVLEDIDNYNAYCESHPGYKNNKAVLAIANIKQVYLDCLNGNKFLE